MIRRHQWSSPIDHMPAEECLRCGTTRETLELVGIRRQRALRSYVRPDGIRFTGQAPECEPALKNLGRPIMQIFADWRARLTEVFDVV